MLKFPTSTLSLNFSSNKFLVGIDHANGKMINSLRVQESLFPGTIALILSEAKADS